VQCRPAREKRIHQHNSSYRANHKLKCAEAQMSVGVRDVIGAAEEECCAGNCLRCPPNAVRPARTALEAMRDIVKANRNGLNCTVKSGGAGEGAHQRVGFHAPVGERVARRPCVVSCGAVFHGAQENPSFPVCDGRLIGRSESGRRRQINAGHGRCGQIGRWNR
jgi:hypothetical protein